VRHVVPFALGGRLRRFAIPINPSAESRDGADLYSTVEVRFKQDRKKISGDQKGAGGDT
jgi:hypothetical protein